MPLSIRITLGQQQTFDLQCGTQSRRVNIPEIESLITGADRDYFSDPSTPQKLIALGRRLYQWLDGPEGWLRAGLTNRETVLLLDLATPLEAPDLNPATGSLLRNLAHLPWELLHDGSIFLAERDIQPIRVMQSRTATTEPAANRPLRLLFMATSPEDVAPVLDYEREEATILKATKQQPIDLVVEESGSVAQLKNLVASFDKGYFDIFHITGHGTIEDDTPQFITEDERGGDVYSTADDLADAFGHRWPRLLFLSGCHSAEAPKQGTIPSMAHALVNAGADAVLGWARPVYDTTGIFAATRLYHALATGETVVDAVASTRREMLRTSLQNPKDPTCSDWHLLRLYQGVRDAGALVTPRLRQNRKRVPRKEPETAFLDAEGRVKVAVATAFFGRRRETQRCLRALAHSSDYYGVFLHGIGGYGKSTIAARLCRRHEALNPGFDRVVLVGPVDEDRLRQRLSDKFGGIPEATAVLNDPRIPFKHQLAQVFRIVEDRGAPLLLVLDDFEQNIPESNIDNASFRLAVGAWKALEAICFALDESAGASRLIVTCRYHSPDALPPNRLFIEGLSGMLPTDVDKKVEFLAAEAPDSKRDLKREEKIVKVADGNPRLLERLMTLSRQTDLIEDQFLDQLESAVTEFRENILAQKLLAALAEPERKTLARMTVFELAVPMPVVTVLAAGAPLAHSLNLGLLERQTTPDEDLYRVSVVLHSLLQTALTATEWAESRQQAARALYDAWWQEAEHHTESRGLEVVRVGLVAGEQDIAVGPADVIATSWINRSRYQEAVALCCFVLGSFDDYRILGTIARAEVVLGEVGAARQHFEVAILNCAPADDTRLSQVLSNLANLEAEQQQIERALGLWQRCLEISDRSGSTAGKAAAFHGMASVFCMQGNVPRALQLWQQSLEISESAGDMRAVAATLANMAVVNSSQGNIKCALQMLQRCSEITSSIGDMKGKASILHNLAVVIAQQGDIERAQQLWGQSLEIRERIGDMNGKASTLGHIAIAVAQQGNTERALQIWQQCQETMHSIGDLQGEAALIHNMASILYEKGETKRAVQLWDQSLSIKSRIGDIGGKAATLAQLAHVAHQSGDQRRSEQLNRQAAIAFASINAYPDLITVLHNLGCSAQQERDIFAAQAVWLIFRTEAPLTHFIDSGECLFHQIPKGDPLELPLATALMIVVATRGKTHPEHKKFRARATKLVGIAAGNADIQDEEAMRRWVAENHLDDPDHVFPTLQARLEELIGDRWLFDRTPLLDRSDSAPSGPS
jgi:tetratricopeptide (TPR) repeat protein